MYRLIESYDRSGTTLDVRGQAFPLAALLEDDEDATRFVLAGTELSLSIWERALQAGAVYAIRPGMFGEGWESLYIGESDEWAQHDAVPTWREVVEAATTKPEQHPAEFVHLHAHSEYSALDGYSQIGEMVATVVDDGQPALALTDHGVAAGHPQLQIECAKADIKPIYGEEFYFTDDRHGRGDGTKDGLYAYWHLTAWAKTTEGLRNIWALTSEANREGFYGRPRIDWDSLQRYRSGIAVSTGCLRGPVPDAIVKGNEDMARSRLARLLDIFGDDLRIEIQTNDLAEQKKVNKVLVELGNEFGVPLIAAADSHYSRAEHHHFHKVWVAMQTNTDLQDDTDLFAGDTQYHLMTADEVREALSDLPESVVAEAMQNTVDLAAVCDASLEGKTAPPIFSKKGGVKRDNERLDELCRKNWSKTEGKTHPQEVYEARYKREMKLLTSREVCGYYLVVSDYCRWAREHGILVGPGRGSGSGSLVAYLAGIVGIDPVEAGLLFERFLTEGRKALPDFDVDFPTSKREDITNYIASRYGDDHVVRVGTTIRLKNKGVIRDLARVLKNTIEIHYPDIEEICQVITAYEADTAGLGLSWDNLMDLADDEMAPFRDKYPEMFALADALVGRVKSYGKHPAGVVISDEVLNNRLPLKFTEDGQAISEFDMESLEALGYNKFDILTLRTLDTLQQTLDLIVLIEKWGGKRPPLEEFDEEFNDPQVWDEICAGRTLGVFQVETKAGTRMCKRQKPRSIKDLADVVTLVRPGPVRSGLTEVYLRRRDGEEEVTYLDERIREVLEPTYGVILYQEQILLVCQKLAGYSLAEADEVRRILGKKKVALVQAEGTKFVARCVEHGLERQMAEDLWEQLAEFAKYSFNLSHAYAYAMMAFYCAWLKIHYVPQFMVSVLSTVKKERIPEFIGETRRLGYFVEPPDINLSKSGFSHHQLSVRYGLDSVKGVGDAAVAAITQGQPYESLEDFMERRGKAANMGVIKTLAKVGAFDSVFPNRRALESLLEWQVNMTGSMDCIHRNDSHLGPNGLPCVFDWSKEPVPLGKRGQPLKPKPIPKRCTRACRNYEQGEPDVSDIEPYSDEAIRNREMEYLGVHLSSTPFDIIPEDVMSEVLDAERLDEAPDGEHVIVATIKKVRPWRDSRGRDMAFLTMHAVNGDVDVTVFSGEYSQFSSVLRKDFLCFAFVDKNDRGCVLKHMEVL